MLYGLGKLLKSPIDLLNDVHTNNKRNSEEVHKISDEIDSLDLIGKFINGEETVSLGLSYLMYTRVQHVGKMGALINSIVGIATENLCYDIPYSTFSTDVFQEVKDVQGLNL